MAKQAHSERPSLPDSGHVSPSQKLIVFVRYLLRVPAHRRFALQRAGVLVPLEGEAVPSRAHHRNTLISPCHGQSSGWLTNPARTGFRRTYSHFS